MKRSLAAAILLVLSAVAAAAQTAPDAADLTKMLNDFLAGASKNDPAAHDRFWADDLIYTRSSGVRTNKAEIMKSVRSAPAPKPDDAITVYSAEDILIQQYGDTAIVAFRLVIDTTNKDGTKKTGNNLNTGVFLRRKGVWQVVAWQSTVVPDAKSEAVAPTPKSDPKPVVQAQTSADKPAKSDGQHTYLKGSRGGCYYLNATGGKVYVDHKYCQ
ncbi:MAG: nuclear transport factor 2 family protein [Acidobacteria bacterium]|nr:nuclear transport factor 2 family protein [Acidobacteriota bacterium]